MLHQLSIIGINFHKNEISMTKKMVHCALVLGYNGPLGWNTTNMLKICWFGYIWSLLI